MSALIVMGMDRLLKDLNLLSFGCDFLTAIIYLWTTLLAKSDMFSVSLIGP
jgi:hypothetical protein